MKSFLICVLLFATLCCRQKKEASRAGQINALAEKYVRLGLTIGEYDGDFVDAYYGPDSLKPANPKIGIFPKDSLLKQIDSLRDELKRIAGADQKDTLSLRAN